MDDGFEEGEHEVSSFTYPVSKGVENTTSFTPHKDWNKVPTRKWLGEEARGLVDQRSNVELFCILTCYSRYLVIEKDFETAPHDGDVPWMENIRLWASAHKDLAKTANATLSY